MDSATIVIYCTNLRSDAVLHNFAQHALIIGTVECCDIDDVFMDHFDTPLDKGNWHV